MSNHSGSGQSRVKRQAALLAMIATLLAAIGISLGSSAHADTSGSPDTNTRAALAPATADATNGQLPGTTLAGAVQGTVVNIHVDGPAGKVFAISGARLCRSGLDVQATGDMSPSSSGDCIASPFHPGSDDSLVTAPSPNNTSVDAQFRLGTGTEASHTGPGAAITCDADNPCALWIWESVDASITPDNSGNIFKHYDVTYTASAPGAPSITVTPSNTTLGVSVTPPSNPGNPVFTTYTVSISPADGANPTQTAPKSQISYTFTGLSNFTTYTVSAVAHNTHFDSTAGTGTGTPTPPAAAPPTGTAGDSQVVLSWSQPAGPVPQSYDVLATATNGGTIATPNPRNTPGSPYTFTGLQNGKAYTFQVRAQYSCASPPAGSTTCPGAYSAASAPIAPGFLVQQQITVTRPAGALVLTQVCGVHSADPATPSVYPAVGPGTHPTSGQPFYNGSTPAPFSGTSKDTQYPNYPTAGSYPTGCGIDMGTATLLTSGSNRGQFFQSIAPLNEVTVSDTRELDPGFTVNGQMSDFTNTVTGARGFSGSELGWVPQVFDKSPGFVDSDGNGYFQDPIAGPTADPNTPNGFVNTPTKGNLGKGTQLAQAVHQSGLATSSCPAGASTCTKGGLGIAIFDAKLTLWIPVTVPSGTYSGILSITAA